MEMAPAAELFAVPRHPYTRALLEAVPRLDPSVKRQRVALQGDPPSAARLPPGCVFSTRCGHAESACREAEPELQDDRGHAIACRRWRELAPIVEGEIAGPEKVQ
jgi:peptide/nickel transport system ATP-binding protein